MRRCILAGLVTTVLVMAASGCATAVEQASSPVPPRLEATMMPTLDSITEAVLADAAIRTGLEKARLKIDRTQAVTWADGSLGCPQPGMSYTMALVPGYRITVRAGAELLDYHASERGYFVLCLAGRAEEPAGEERM
jgi:hypothetical protein